MAVVLGPGLGIAVYFAIATLGLFGAARLARAHGGRTFSGFQLRYQSLTLLLALAVLAATLLLRPAEFARFARLGDMAAVADPAPWLGIAPTDNWRTVGLSMGGIITLTTLGFLLIQARRQLPAARAIVVLAPLILGAAAANAFTEEALYRFVPAATLSGALSPAAIMLLSAGGFGLAHFGGTPGGPIGAAMAAFLGGFLAKALLETQGMGWPLAIHFVQDVVIMAFLAASPSLQRSRGLAAPEEPCAPD